MKQLSGMDAFFLYHENRQQPMHVGGVMIFEPQKGGIFDFSKHKEFLDSRLHSVTTTRERLVNVPFNLGYPYWLEDPDFDLDYHLHHTALPKPGGWDQLTKMASHIFGIRLDRSRPLWEITIVEGLDSIPDLPKGSFAVISKIHHAAIDGASGAEIMGAVLATTPKDVPLKEKVKWEPEEVPSDRELIKRSLINAAKDPLKIIKLLSATVKGSVIAGALWKVKKVRLPKLIFTAPRTRFNNLVTANRTWDSIALDLQNVKDVKNHLKVTINDAILAVCGGAIRKYLISLNELPKTPLIAMLPVNIREESEKNTAGNKVSGMTASLATHEPDATKRVQKIHQSTTQSKIYHHATSAKKLSDYSSFVPYSLGGIASRFYSKLDMSEKHAPMFNCVITNVPGPQIPLYMNGAKLYNNYGMAPILDGAGLIIVINSYNGGLTISVTSCREIIKDSKVFMGFMQESYDELVALTKKEVSDFKELKDLLGSSILGTLFLCA